MLALQLHVNTKVVGLAPGTDNEGCQVFRENKPDANI
jgi:hypothetical protein